MLVSRLFVTISRSEHGSLPTFNDRINRNIYLQILFPIRPVMVSMSAPYEEVSEEPPGSSETSEATVPSRYKIAIGLLLVSLVIVSLLWFQQSSLLQLKNNQLSSQTSSLNGNVSDLNKIVALQKSQLLEGNQSIEWLPGVSTMALGWSCKCFQYSGYLRVNWASATDLSLRIVQFGLNLTTPSKPVGDFRIPISSGGPFVAEFDLANCSDQTGCNATYSAVYHY